MDEDNDGQISFREFLLIFRKAARGELQAAGLTTIANSVDVSEVSVMGIFPMQANICFPCLGRRGRCCCIL